MRKRLIAVLLAVISSTTILSCGGDTNVKSELSMKEQQRMEAKQRRYAEKKMIKDKYKMCSLLAKYSYNEDSYRESVQLEKIRNREFDDAECQHHYDTQLNKLTSGTWLRRITNYRWEPKRVVIHQSTDQ